MTTHKDDERVNGSRLRELREAKGFTPEYLARLCSLSLHQVHELENGGSQRFYSSQIKINAARKAAQVLSVDVSELLFEPLAAAQELLAQVPARQLQTEPAKLSHAEPPSASWAAYLIVLTVLLGAGMWWFQEPRAFSLPSYKTGSQQDSPAGAEMQTALSFEAQSVGVSVPQALAKEPEVQACNFEEEMLVLEAKAPNKPANKVSLMMHRQGELCIQDGTGKVWREDLNPWLGRNFKGTAPWRITSPVLFYGDVYFQGEKIQIPSQKVRSITLNAKLSSP
ncbi:helix-turn-helix domain-containing protein [Limnohabitans sp. Rim8]|uniref:helix-turn-helix domain-containing protein n=1 Tax=Limnohabitans sp. Rim8 TaxID=1100718 RepID=UPI0033056D79